LTTMDAFHQTDSVAGNPGEKVNYPIGDNS